LANINLEIMPVDGVYAHGTEEAMTELGNINLKIMPVDGVYFHGTEEAMTELGKYKSGDHTSGWSICPWYRGGYD
jgi:hypothetical protein